MNAGVGELYAIYVEPALVGTGRGHGLLVCAEELLARDHAEATLWEQEGGPAAPRVPRRFTDALRERPGPSAG